ncbi:MAG: hypothetical protein M3P52_02045, partial [Actinomycetota bacterium]|nr:hypothetical protein [Actinomycetota bacterium]
VPETTTSTAVTTTTSAPTTTTEAEPTRPTRYWDVPAGIEVAVAAEDGLHLLTGSDDRIIHPGLFDKVVAEPTGDGWFVQEDSATIRHIGDDGSDEVVVSAEAETFVQLHDAGMVDGQVTVFYNVNLVRSGFGDPESLDELFALDLATGERRKITDVGGWETSIDVKYGEGNLVGVWASEALVEPWSVDLGGRLDSIDIEKVGLATSYSDDPAAPRALAISADGSRVSWVSWNIPDGQFVSQRLVSANTDGSDVREFTLPEGPARADDIVDRGDYLVAGSWRLGDGSRTPAALIDAETGGMLVLPVEGPAAARGQWTEPPQWAIPSPVTEDITEEIRALEPQWTGAPFAYEEALTDLLIGDDTEGECASTARSFPDYGPGDGPFYIELRQFCDDSVAGSWYAVTVVGPMPDGSLTGGATRRTLCRRGVTSDGLCV